MSLILIKDSKGKKTGVFIPMKEWNEISEKHSDLKKLLKPEIETEYKIEEITNNFKLSEKQLEMLNEASNAGPERYTSLDDFNSHIKIKYGI